MRCKACNSPHTPQWIERFKKFEDLCPICLDIALEAAKPQKSQITPSSPSVDPKAPDPYLGPGVRPIELDFTDQEILDSLYNKLFPVVPANDTSAGTTKQ